MSGELAGCFLERAWWFLAAVFPKVLSNVCLCVLEHGDVFSTWRPFLPSTCQSDLVVGNFDGGCVDLNPDALAVGVVTDETCQGPRTLLVLTRSPAPSPEGHGLTWLQVLLVPRLA